MAQVLVNRDSMNLEGRKREKRPASAVNPKLDRALARGIAWTGVIKWGSQILSWLATIIVARILVPADYGLVAMAGVFLGVISVMSEFGVGTAVVALRNLTSQQISQTHMLACGIGVAGCIAASAIAIPAAAFFRAPDLSGVIMVAGLGFLLVGCRSVPAALFEKELRFKLLALLEGSQAVLMTAATVGIAWWGGGYWALVLGPLAGQVWATGVLTALRPIKFSCPTKQSMREVARFSSQVLLGRLSWHFASSSDVLIGGRALGQAIIGAYSFGSIMASMPMEKVTSLVSRVMPAFYSAVQSDPLALRRYFLLMTEAIAIITFPIGVGLALTADQVVHLILGSKWEQSIAPLQILAVWGAVRSIAGLVSPILYVTGGTRVVMTNGLLCVALFPVGFLVGSLWGVVGLALAWTIVQPISLIRPYSHVLDATDLSFIRYLESLKPAAISVVLMAGCVLLVRHMAPLEWVEMSRLSVEVLSGMAAYILILLAFWPERIRSLRSVFLGTKI